MALCQRFTHDLLTNETRCPGNRNLHLCNSLGHDKWKLQNQLVRQYDLLIFWRT